jgi:probable HAF family extracellular repeat protein
MLDEAVGSAWAITGGQRGVLWREGKPIQLGNFGGGQSRAYDINDLSQVVGWATNSGGIDEAFFWESGTMHRVEDLIAGGSGFQILGRAFAVNNSSQVVTIGFGGGLGHYLVLNPVPEPAPFIAMAVGLAIVAFSRHRRRG